jgi:ferric-dicitrate binding protein FerR (iron transport regulator)
MSACADLHPYLDGRLSGEALAAFEAHLNGCEACRSATASWRRFQGRFREATVPLLTEPTLGDEQRLKARVEQRPTIRWVPALATALALALVAVAAWWSTHRDAEVAVARVGPGSHAEPLASDQVEAPAGNEVELAVADARVVVAERSQLRIERHTEREVRLRLERGAVRLEVQHRAPGQRFRVEAGAFDVQVVGTKFSVTREGDAVGVTVREGRVRVLFAERALDVPAGSTLRANGTEANVAPSEPDAPPTTETNVDVDAGVLAEVDAGVTREEEGPKARAPLDRWRQQALAGGCAAVMPEIRKHLAAAARDVAALRILADCQRMTGADAQAIATYERVVALGREDDADRARLLLADLYVQRGKHRAAEQALRAFLSHGQSPGLEAAARLKLAGVLIAQGRNGEARAELERVKTRLPGTPSALEAVERLKTLPEK